MTTQVIPQATKLISDPSNEAEYPEFKGCRSEILPILDEYANTAKLAIAERPEVILISLDGQPTLYIDSPPLPPQIRDAIKQITKTTNLPLVFNSDYLQIEPISPKHPAAQTYARCFPQLTHILGSAGLDDWGHVLLDSNHGPIVIVGGGFDANVRSEIGKMFKEEGIRVGFCPIEEMGEDGFLAKAVDGLV